MLLTFDIGNTNIVIGIFNGAKLSRKWRIISDTRKSSDDYAVDLIELFLNDKIDCLEISRKLRNLLGVFDLFRR